MARPSKYPDELRERAVRLVFEPKRPIAHVARDLSVHKEAPVGALECQGYLLLAAAPSAVVNARETRRGGADGTA